MKVFFIVFFLDSPNVNDDSEEEDSHTLTQQSDLDELLINEIQAHPLIWNKQSAEYKRLDKKKIVWASIATKLGITGSTLFPMLRKVVLYFHYILST